MWFYIVRKAVLPPAIEECSLKNREELILRFEILLSGLLTYLLVHTWEAFKIQSILDRKDVS